MEPRTMSAETPTHTGTRTYQEPRQTETGTVDVKTWGIFTHLSSLTYILGGVLAFLGPLIVWLVGKDKAPMIDAHGKEALNFGITVSILAVGIWVLAALATFTFGAMGALVNLLWIALFVFWVVFMIIATVKASQNVVYHYPVSMRLVR